MCDSFVKCVTGSYLISVTQLPYIFQRLTLMCDRCDRCDSFFELYLRFFQNTVFFYKLNFNLKLPVTPVTHLYNPRDYSLFAISKLSHMLSHTCHTCPCSCHTPPNPNRESWFVNHKPHRRLTIINNGVITAFKLSHAFL